MNYEIIDATELAKRLALPESWLRAATRERTPKNRRIPHLRFGKYVRFAWQSPDLDEWLSKRCEWHSPLK
jgi:hypothetical protein